MIYKSRGLKRRRNTDKWEVTLAHKDPMTGEVELSYHTVEATTRKKAEKERDRLIQDLQGKGSACTSQMTIKDFLDEFIQYKEDSGRIEPSTINHYRKQTKMVCRYLDGVFAKEAEGPALGFSFTIEQLEFMLAEAKRHKEGGDDGFEAILVPAC